MRKISLEKQLPQNLKTLLQGIGESTTAFHLFSLTEKTDWRVYKNLQEPGYDLAMVNTEKRKTIRIEVKTRQSIYTTAKSENTKNIGEFEITQNEYDNADFLICYWLDYNAHFIIPKRVIKESSLKIKISKSKKEGEISFGKYEEFKNRWKLIEAML